MDGQRLLGITGGDGPGGSALTERIVAYDGALCRPFCRTDRGAVQKWPLRGSVTGPCFRGASARALLGSLQPKRRCPAVGAFLGGLDACRELPDFYRDAHYQSELQTLTGRYPPPYSNHEK